VRTQTLVKGAVVQVDATPFRQWYHQHYGLEVGVKKANAASAAAAAAKPKEEPVKQSAHVVRKHDTRVKAAARCCCVVLVLDTARLCSC
jgi:small subunit ribosomal protein S8e